MCLKTNKVINNKNKCKKLQINKLFKIKLKQKITIKIKIKKITKNRI